MLASALGTPLGFDCRTLENLQVLTTSNDVIVCVEACEVCHQISQATMNELCSFGGGLEE